MRKFSFIVLVVLCLSACAVLAQSPVRVEIDPTALGVELTDFSGLSYETLGVMPNDKGENYFRPDNKPLVTLFKTLGIKSLRLGGNTADRPATNPTIADIDKLFAFAKAADVKVIYTFRLQNGDPATAAPIAKHIMDHHKANLFCFAIGNEPNVFTTDYKVYLDTWKKYAATVTAAAPDAKFCGPSSTGDQILWARDFAGEFAPGGQMNLITFHLYPGGNAARVTDNNAARAKLLSPELLLDYEKMCGPIVRAAKERGHPFRLEEVNSFWNGGRKDVSDSFVSALWGLDYMYWWASQGASGLNFHTGDFVARQGNARCDYAAFWTSDNGYAVRPLSYAFKAFDLARNGNLVSTRMTENAEKANLSAYAALGRDRSLSVTLINKENGPAARAARIEIVPRGTFSKVESMTLAAPNADLADQTNVTVGGSKIKEDGTWDGRWSPLGSPGATGEIAISLPASSAIVVRLTP